MQLKFPIRVPRVALTRVSVVVISVLSAACSAEHEAPQARTSLELPSAPILELASRSRRLPADLRSAKSIDGLLRHVRRGGGLLLRGYALELLPALGLTTRRPRRRVVTRGFDGPASRGLGLGLVCTQAGSAALGGLTDPVEVARTPLMRVEIDAFEEMDLSAGGQIFAQEYVAEGEQMRLHTSAVLCGWQVGAGRVLALGMRSDEEAIAAPLRARALRWLAGGRDDAAVATVLDLPPSASVDAWAAPAEATLAHGAAPVMRVHASMLDGNAAEVLLERIEGAGVSALILDDDGASLERFARRRQRIVARGMRFGIAAERLRPELAELLDARGGEHAALDIFVVALGRQGATEVDATLFHRAFRNGRTQVWTPRPWRSSGACATAYVPADAARPRSEATPSAPVRSLHRFPPACYGVLEIDCRAKRGAWIDAVHARARAFTVGRPGATIMLRMSLSPGFDADLGRRPQDDAMRHALTLARVLRDPLLEAASFRMRAGGPSGFEAARRTLEAARDDEAVLPRRRADPQETEHVLSTSPASLRNRWFRLVSSRVDVDPRGMGRFDHGAGALRLTQTWGRGEVHGMRIGDPKVLAQLLAPLDVRVPDFDLGAGRPFRAGGRFEPGRYTAAFVVENLAADALLEFVDPEGRSAFLGVPRGERREVRVPFQAAASPDRSFAMRLHRGAGLRVLDLHVRGSGIESVLEESEARSAEVAQLDRVAHSGQLVTREVSVAAGDLPGLVQILEFRKSRSGLRLRHALRFDGYRITRVQGGFSLRADGRPDLELRTFELGRMRTRIEGDTWVLEGHPRAWERTSFAIVLPQAVPTGVDDAMLDRALHRLAKNALGGAHAAGPRGAAGARASSLRVARGSEAIVEILDEGATWAELRVHASTELQPSPGLRFSKRTPACIVQYEGGGAEPESDAARRLWHYADATTLFVPRRAGRYRVEWSRRHELRGPRVLASRASIEECHYDEERRQLSFVVVAPSPRVSAASYVVRIRAPSPAQVVGAAVLDASDDDVLVLSAPPGRVHVRWP